VAAPCNKRAKVETTATKSPTVATNRADLPALEIAFLAATIPAADTKSSMTQVRAVHEMLCRQSI